MADSQVDSGDATVENVNNNDNSSPAVQQEQPAPAPAQSKWAMLKSLAMRMIFIYAISSFFRGRSNTTTNTSTTGGGPIGAYTNVYPAGMSIVGIAQNDKTEIYVCNFQDMYMYISEDESFSEFKDKKMLIWLEEDLSYGDWTGGLFGDGSYILKGQIEISEAAQNNGSFYLHTYFVRSGDSPDPENKDTYNKKTTIYKSKMLNRYKRRILHSTVNLLTGKTDVHPDLIKKKDGDSIQILSHWHPNISINLVDDHTPWTPAAVQAPIKDLLDFLPAEQQYQPIIFYNDYWNLNADYMPINETTPVLNYTLTFTPMSLFKLQLYASQGMKNQWTAMISSGDDANSDGDDQDIIKQTFLDTNPYLLGITIVVSIVHSVFEFLAFKNDIQFWRNRKSLEGLSVRTVFYGVFQSLVVLLYVLDNETNFTIRLSVGVGLLIEIWKIHKVINVKVDHENKLLGLIPRVRFEDKSSYTESDTKKYDKIAFKYMGWLLFPLLVGYAAYSVVYQEHKGWYSWVLSMAYGFLLTFGFIMMTPQLFINYKLKSVAHLPWRMLSYKALNTFIDDLFAFVIKMPTLYRIGCFRDDIIFCIYIYQRYIYRVDPKRMNEFGTSADMFDKDGKIIPEDKVADGETKSILEKKDD